MKITAKQLKLYAVTDRSWLRPGETLAQVVEELLEAGVTCLQLREKDAPDDLFIEEALELKEICSRYHVPLIINDRPDIAREAGADGVHLGLSDMQPEKTRELLGDGFIIGGSAHNVQESLAAQAAGVDYIGCGAVFGSHTKEDVTSLRIEELKAICQSVHIPTVAIGGINLDNISLLAETGVNGVAVISALFAAEDKTAAVKEFLKLLKQF